jgi:hypothetical protein
MEKIILYCKKFLFENTEAEFTECECDRLFDELKCDPDNIHWFSPSGQSEFILTPLWHIYRRGKWPVTHNGCNWTKTGSPENNVGFIQINRFKPTI